MVTIALAVLAVSVLVVVAARWWIDRRFKSSVTGTAVAVGIGALFFTLVIGALVAVAMNVSM